MIINGSKEVLLRLEGGEIVNSPLVYNHDTNISSVAFEQRYKGSANTPTACLLEYTEDYNGPDYNVTQECGKITVTKQPSTPNIQSVTGKKGNTTISFTPSAGNTVWTATGGELNMNGEVEVTVSFQNSCTLTKKVEIFCSAEITATPTDTFARGECPGGTNPDVVVSVVSGFTSAVKFSKDGINYVNPDSTSPTIQKTFTNFSTGTYTFYAKETINGVEVIDTVVVTINPMLKPTLSKTDICGNTQGSIQILNAAPGSTWKIFGPAYNGYTVSIGTNGSSTPIAIAIDKPGQYIARIDNDPTNSMCTGDLTIDVANNGGTITPTVTMSSQIICNGGELFLRIDDGGVNLTYNVSLSSANGGQLQDLDGNTISTLQANNTGVYNAKIVGLNTGSSTAIYNFVITGISNNQCYVLSPATITKSYSVQPGPTIGNISASCSNACQRDCYDILVSISGAVTNVTIGGSVATLLSPGVWRVAGLQTLTPPTIIATNSSTGCSDTVTMSVLPDCDGRAQCPEQTIVIADNPDSPTCGVQTVSLYYAYSSLGDIDGAEYRWYKTTGGILQLISSGIISGSTVPQQEVTSSFTTETYVLMIVTNNGICEYTSNEIDVYAAAELAPEILGAGIAPDTTLLVTGQTYSYSTGFIPGATYTWTLTNSNGSNQPVGTNSNAISISSFAEGPNTINLTVNNGICTGAASVNLNVGLSCPTVTIGLATGGDGCQNILPVIDNPLTGVTATSYTWYIDSGSGPVATSQTGSGAPPTFDASEVGAGETVDISLVVVFSNTCEVTSNVLEYERCDCLCIGTTTCSSGVSFTLTEGSPSYTTSSGFSDGKVLTIEIAPGICPDNLTIRAGATVILDTGATISGTTEAEMETPPGNTDCTTDTKLNGVGVGTLFIGDGLVSGDFSTYNLTYLDPVITYGAIAAPSSTPCSVGCGAGNRSQRSMIIELTVDSSIDNVPLIFENLGTITSGSDGAITKSMAITVTCN